MSSTEQNKAVVRDLFENASQGRFDVIGQFITPDYVNHPDDVRGVEGLTAMVQEYRAALSNLKVTVEHQFADGDYVATRTTVSGRHDGELMGAPATGREVAVSMLTISRCKDGKIEEEWEIIDAVSLLQQVGALPEPATA